MHMRRARGAGRGLARGVQHDDDYYGHDHGQDEAAYYYGQFGHEHRVGSVAGADAEVARAVAARVVAAHAEEAHVEAAWAEEARALRAGAPSGAAREYGGTCGVRGAGGLLPHENGLSPHRQGISHARAMQVCTCTCTCMHMHIIYDGDAGIAHMHWCMGAGLGACYAVRATIVVAIEPALTLTVALCPMLALTNGLDERLP